MGYFYDKYVLSLLKRILLAFYRHPWITFTCFAMSGFWTAYTIGVFTSQSVWFPGIVITTIVLFGVLPIFAAGSVQDKLSNMHKRKDLEMEMEKLRNEIQELESL